MSPPLNRFTGPWGRGQTAVRPDPRQHSGIHWRSPPSGRADSNRRHLDPQAGRGQSVYCGRAKGQVKGYLNLNVTAGTALRGRPGVPLCPLASIPLRVQRSHGYHLGQGSGGPPLQPVSAIQSSYCRTRKTASARE
jgi:hypothetical protein